MVSKDIKQIFYLSSRLLLIVSQITQGKKGKRFVAKTG